MHYELQPAAGVTLNTLLMSATPSPRPKSHWAGRSGAGRLPDHHQRRHLSAAVAGPGGAAAHRRLQVRPAIHVRRALRAFPTSIPAGACGGGLRHGLRSQPHYLLLAADACCS
jgi:hypothetical protein